jgi:hypothetical protein
VKFPPELRNLLLETDGVMDTMEYHGKFKNTGWFLWPTDEIEKNNIWFRSALGHDTYDRSFHNLLFFTGAGVDGILFAYIVASGQVEESNIHVWHPIDDTVELVAPSLNAFIEKWKSGELTV